MDAPKIIYDAIIAKSAIYTNQIRYYDGDQPTVYLTERLAEIFRGVSAKISQNWCSVVVDSLVDRINLKGFETEDKQAKAILDSTWETNNLAIESSDVHQTATINSEAFIIAWPGEDGNIEVYYNDPRLIHVVYQANNPREIAYAGKIYNGDDNLGHMTIYYPDHIQYYITDKPLDQVTDASAFKPDTSVSQEGTAINTFGIVPVFHFRTNRRGISDLANVIPLQDAINKLLIDMMVAAEYGAFKQRWVISQGETSGLKNSPNSIWDLPASDGTGQGTQVGEFNATDLNNYLNSMNALASSIGVITRTPKHYFYSQGGDPSGEALIALEAPLNHKAQDRIDRFTPTWKELASFICLMAGITIPPSAITPKFDTPETIQPRTGAEITKIRRDSGVPLTTALRWEGKTDTEIQAMEAELEKETQKAKSNMAEALLRAERQMRAEQQFPVGGNPTGNQEIQPTNGKTSNQNPS